MKDPLIVTCCEYFVKERAKTCHPLKIPETLKPDAIMPHLKKPAASLVRCRRVQKPVHISALNVAGWELVQSMLELFRVYA